jgi:hypothetical protein
MSSTTRSSPASSLIMPTSAPASRSSSGYSSDSRSGDSDSELPTDFEEQVNRWLRLDNELKKHYARIQEIRKQHQQLEKRLIDYAIANGMYNIPYEVNGEKIKFANARVTEPLTFKYLEKALASKVKDPAQARQILEHVRKARQIKTIREIKRYANTNK